MLYIVFAKPDLKEYFFSIYSERVCCRDEIVLFLFLWLECAYV